MATFCSRVPTECGWSLPGNLIACFSSSSAQSCLPHYLSGVPTHTPPSWTPLSLCLFPRDADLWLQHQLRFTIIPKSLTHSLFLEFSLITWHSFVSLLCWFLFLSSNFNVIVVWNHILDLLYRHPLLGSHFQYLLCAENLPICIGSCPPPHLRLPTTQPSPSELKETLSLQVLKPKPSSHLWLLPSFSDPASDPTRTPVGPLPACI